ncbi:hypothetical protein CTAYLR_002984 [Chrysophaeum taylorii]|uniref:Calmodulin n=1 Tax=Chrysophaeum taylorii TaxID=2483200 RepID=A0AAD7U6U1_9STRA|nr:hypothetical protein CTAYLR_002984 [Chrysophaeum taylorii]
MDDWSEEVSAWTFYPVVEVGVEVEGMMTWVPARIVTWRKAANERSSVAVVSFLGFEAEGTQECGKEDIRELEVQDEGGDSPRTKAALKPGTPVRAVYLGDREWYEATIVDASKDYATVLFTEYDETQATALPLIRVVEKPQEEEEVVEEGRVAYYVALARSGVPIEVVEAAAEREDIRDIRSAVAEARRTKPTQKIVTNRGAMVRELEESQCFEDAFLRRVFAAYDSREPLGKLSPLDFVDALKHTGLATSALELFVAFDGDEDGQMDYDEFKDGIKRLVYENSDGARALVWYWRELQEEWWAGTGTAKVENHPIREAIIRGNNRRRRRDSGGSTTTKSGDEFLEGIMQQGGTMRELARPCLVKLDSKERVLTIWHLSSGKEAIRTTSLPDDRATARGRLADASIFGSRTTRAWYRCDLIVDLKPGGRCKLWLPRPYVERARWITELDRCAAISRSEDPEEVEEAPRLLEEEEEEDDLGLAPNLLVVWVHRGRDLAVKDKSVLKEGTSDPYVRFYATSTPGLWRATRVVRESLDPVWNQRFELPFSALPDALWFVCADHDAASRDDFMGAFRVDLRALHSSRGLLVDREWYKLVSKEIPEDDVTKALGNTSSKNIKGEVEVSVAFRHSSNSIFDLPSFEPSTLLSVGILSACLKNQRRNSWMDKANAPWSPRVRVSVLGSGAADKATTARPFTYNPIWAELLVFDDLPHDDSRRHVVLEFVLEDHASPNPTPIAKARLKLDPTTPLKDAFALDLQDAAHTPPGHAAAAAAAAASDDAFLLGTLEINLAWSPTA